MTSAEFRKLALSLPDAVEMSHHGHPDFRIGGKIFATLPKQGRGMVRLPVKEQKRLVAEHPDVFEPGPGAWGRQGCTIIILAAAKKTIVLAALRAAWMGR